jgi:hypothetical protein
LYKRREKKWLEKCSVRPLGQGRVPPRQALVVVNEGDDSDDDQPPGNVVRVLPDLPANGSRGFASAARRRPSSSRVGGVDDDEDQFELTTRGQSVPPAESSFASVLLDNSAMGLLAKVHHPEKKRRKERNE